MVVKKNIIKNIKRFYKELKKNNVINIKSIYLFGSSVKGNINSYSDIDVAIISDSFTGFRYEDRAKINPFILKTNINIEIHPFSPEEFNRKNPFAKEIILNGIKIY